MTNLREEIYRWVYNHNEEQYGKCEECEYRTDLIIKAIEKRIDAIRLPQIEENRTYTKSDLEYLAVCIIEDVKREMLT